MSSCDILGIFLGLSCFFLCFFFFVGLLSVPLGRPLRDSLVLQNISPQIYHVISFTLKSLRSNSFVNVMIRKERTLLFHSPLSLVHPYHFCPPTFLVILRKPSRFLTFLPFSRALPNHNLQILQAALETRINVRITIVASHCKQNKT